MKRYFILLIIFVTTFNCESDDICPESALTTPRLVITFFDINNPDERKNVESLGIYIIKNSELVLLSEINGINTDSIAIPLRDDESVSNFKFSKDFSDDITVIPSGLANHVYIDYDINEVFVSRACGFTNQYHSLNFLNYDPNSNTNTTDNWLQQIIILNDSVTNENQSHVKILH